MKKVLLMLMVLGVVASASATLYSDAAGEEFSGNGILDILSVEVTNDASDIMFTVTLGGDPIAANWGKYMVALDSVAGGDLLGNGWGRPISMPSGMDYWIGSWVDAGGGAETYSWDGVGWNLDNATYSLPSDIGVPAVTTSTVTLTTTLASLGLGLGDSFVFDVFSGGGGGGDSANDALSDPSQSIADWGGPYSSTSSLTYTVVPEPLTMALLGLGSLIAIRRRK